MAYTSELQAFHMLTSVTHSGTQIKGAKGVRLSKHVTRNVISADGNKGPTGRPVQAIDATAVVRYLDLSGLVSETTAAGNLVSNFTKADGNTGSVTLNTMLGGSWDFDGENPEGGMAVQQIFEVLGATVTIGVSQ